MAMDKNYLIINSGSASKKYALFKGGEKIFYAHFEEEGGEYLVSFLPKSEEKNLKINKSDFENSIKYALDLLISERIISSLDEISAVGARVVAPGSYFLSHKVIDEEYLAKLDQVYQEAPLHIDPVIKEIKLIREILKNPVPIVGISDSAFHSEMPKTSQLYAIPQKDAEDLDIYRFGYHGISTRSILRKTEKFLGTVPEKIIICHLGGGSSITAVKNGKTLRTSMGFTPLEGMIMATRVGDIDAGAVLHIARKKKISLNELDDYFNNKCGLLGLSGKTSDVRKLIELEKTGDSNAKLALETLALRVKRYIGEYAALMNGIDFLIFSATIGQRSFTLREKICADMDYLGVKIDKNLNNETQGGDKLIGADESKVKIAVIDTDETLEIYLQSRDVIEKPGL